MLYHLATCHKPGGPGWNRTTAVRVFNPPLYRLSYRSHLQKKAPVDLNQPGLSSGMSSGRFVVARLPAGLCQEGLTHRFVFILIKTEKSRAYDGIRHGAGACLRGAGNGRFRIIVACRYQGCVHSAAEYKYPGAIVKGIIFHVSAQSSIDIANQHNICIANVANSFRLCPGKHRGNYRYEQNQTDANPN